MDGGYRSRPIVTDIIIIKVIRSAKVAIVINIKHKFAKRNEVLSIKIPIIGEETTLAKLQVHSTEQLYIYIHMHLGIVRRMI